MRVSELMSRDVVTIGDTGTCHEAVEQMCRRRVRHLPVLDREGALVGIVTDRDVRHRLFTSDVYRQIGGSGRVLRAGARAGRDVGAGPSVGAASEVAEAPADVRKRCLPVSSSHVVMPPRSTSCVTSRSRGARVGAGHRDLLPVTGARGRPDGRVRPKGAPRKIIGFLSATCRRRLTVTPETTLDGDGSWPGNEYKVCPS
jgi:CBS domain-containing protein